ncbi:CASP-like protein 2D1 isoform X1 [Carica papaya]|uniref:CASP-like protein 2D1 isoform X1 n=1 Tax=Carica papaya TaxID=3649 RepID=UPI000B8D1363|nr:CASP-like protein 2D1 isoform X1 [Carica papaya]
MRRDLEQSEANSTHHKPPSLKLLDSSLRLCVIPLSAATIWVTVTNQQDNSSYGRLEYTNLMGLKYMILISAVTGCYALLAAISSWIKCLVTKAWLFFVSDQIIAYLLVTSGSAVLEILDLTYNGDREITWSEACSSFGNFCHKIKVAVILHAFLLSCFVILSVISAFRVFSFFGPPFLSSQNQEEEKN